MGQGTREFTGTSVMIVFAPVYALVAKALAQTRPLQHAPGLVLALCFAGLGLAWSLPIMPQIRWMETPAIGQAASRLKSRGDSAGRPMSRTSRAPLSISCRSASNTAPPRGSP